MKFPLERIFRVRIYFCFSGYLGRTVNLQLVQSLCKGFGIGSQVSTTIKASLFLLCHYSQGNSQTKARRITELSDNSWSLALPVCQKHGSASQLFLQNDQMSMWDQTNLTLEERTLCLAFSNEVNTERHNYDYFITIQGFFFFFFFLR